MTVIVWDGRSLAVDRQATVGGCRVETRKYRTIDGGAVLAWAGASDTGAWLADLYSRGVLQADWPAVQRTEDWALLVIATPQEVVFYEKQPFPQKAYGPRAWGSGFKYAEAAMWCGADALRAASCACRFDDGCGFGVDVFTLRNGAFTHSEFVL